MKSQLVRMTHPQGWWVMFLLTMALTSRADVAVVSGPDLSRTNSFYVSNRQPLLPSQFVPLPVGSVQPKGWLLEMLRRQKEGLTGHLGEISAWLQKKDNAWLSRTGQGRYGWEELPYWLKGYIELSYIFNDPKMIAEANIWIEGALASQRTSGDFGPDETFRDDGTRDYWANMIMMFCLESYYEYTNDPRVINLMTKYFKYQLTVPDNQLLTHYWQRMRGGDNLYSIYWLYNRTGDPELLKVAEKIHRRTANWKMKNDLPNWHNVNIAECFREPAQFYLQSHDPTDRQAAYDNFREVRRRFGQVPGGMFGGDENCRAGFDDPRQGVETCGMVEQMLSDEILLQITGDTFWADHCEEVAFNNYPAAVMPDFKSLRYLTAPNMALSDSKNHSPGIDNSGPFLMMNPFSCRCCQHNHSHGWPYFNSHLWVATPDDGVCAALYSASEVKVKVANGAQATITEETHYPFEEKISFKINVDKSSTFPFYLRIPAWCAAPKLSINGQAAELQRDKGNFVRIDREWKSGDAVELSLPMQLSVSVWTNNHNSVSVNYGPLTFSLKIGEQYEKHDSTKTAIGDSSWQKDADPSKWPSYEIRPTTAWNYGLVLPAARSEQSFSLKHRDWPQDDFPFTPEAAPIYLEAKAKQIPNWTLDQYGLCAVLQDSPVISTNPVETVSLIPMGAARLRIAAFPVIGEGQGAHAWEPPDKPHPAKYKAAASHVNGSDTVTALSDDLIPKASDDHSIPRFTWWDHRGTWEWVEYDFSEEKKISTVSVYWFDDTGHGQCRIPKAWRVLYRVGNDWEPVPDLVTEAPAKDKWTAARFSPVSARALRLEVGLQPGFSAGILEWRVE